MTPAMPADWLRPDWPAPASVQALVTTRAGGVSGAPYDSLNLGLHVGDDAEAVRRNRARLHAYLPEAPCWLEQVHGVAVADAGGAARGAAASASPAAEVPCADASLSRRPGAVCAVMTADCLPVLFCDRDGTVVAAAHAGWRGLCAGVLEATLARMAVAPDKVLAWLGPAIGPSAFEVGDEVRSAFIERDAGAVAAFAEGAVPGKWLADLFHLASLRLTAAGVGGVYGGGQCTYSDAARFYSYRRDGVTGRFASLVWLSPR